jgi:hypothetical protein
MSCKYVMHILVIFKRIFLNVQIIVSYFQLPITLLLHLKGYSKNEIKLLMVYFINKLHLIKGYIYFAFLFLKTRIYLQCFNALSGFREI